MKQPKLSTFSLLVILIVTFSACQKEPQVDFEVSKLTAVTGEMINFTNNTIDGDSYEWEFGDGLDSDDEDPMHAYQNVGTYEVKLTAYSKNKKKSDYATKTITVNRANEIVFNGTKYALEKGYLENYGYNPDTYNYNFDLTVVSEGLNLTAEGMTGTGEFAYLELWTSSAEGPTTGYYTYSEYGDSNTYSLWLVGFNCNFATQTGTIYECTGGTVSITVNGNMYTVELSLTAGDVSLEVYYKGTLTLLDYTSKKSFKSKNSINKIKFE